MARHRAGVQGRRRTYLRFRALLAAGLVLGVGATVTYASWVDQEFSTATFKASVFDTQSSVDSGTTWADNPTAPGGTLALNAGGIAPSDVKFASFGVRSKAASVAGTLTLNTATVTDTPGTAPLLSSSLQYRVYVGSTNNCSATSTPPAGGAWLAGSAATYVAMTATVAANSTTLAAAGASTPSAPAWYCFQVTLPSGASNSLQGKGATATWKVGAVSN